MQDIYNPAVNTRLNPSAFEKTIEGKRTGLFILKNNNGMEASITNYGARVVSLIVPGKNRNRADVVAGFPGIDGYLKAKEIYFGATIGRYGNRIANGKFSIDDKAFQLATNNGRNHLHGGVKGFNAVVWDARQTDGQTLELSYLSKDGEEGYPGNLNVKVIYSLTDDNGLKVQYEATTGKPTVVNLTHHSFFNLKGEGNGTINEHLLMIKADHYTPVDKELIPTGEIAPVEGTPFDFRKAKPIEQDINKPDKQLKYGHGYDHNFVLNKTAQGGLSLVAVVIEPASGRAMEVWTAEPGLQFYGGNFLKGFDTGKTGKPYNYRSAFCLEAQHFPDSPHKPHFPSTLLRPGETYRSVCIYKFSLI